MISQHPEWALAHKRKGTELKRINGKYYLYEVSSKWSPEKKRPVKITGRILGSVTEERGFVESEKTRLRRQNDFAGRIQIKEYGITAAIETLFADTVTPLKTLFPETWPTLVCLAYGRLVHQAPLKNMAALAAASFLSERHPQADLSAKSLGPFLRETGRARDKIVAYCRAFKTPGDHLLFDGTDIPCHARLMSLPKFSKGKSGAYDEMLNTMWIFSAKRQTPVYYRLLPGNIKDVRAFKLCLLESGIEDATVIIDKGFASQANIDALEQAGLAFILPLRRDNALVDYEKARAGHTRQFDGHFKHEGRFIWHYTVPAGEGKSVTVFLDEELRCREQKDYLTRFENKLEGYTMEDFHERQHRFGTLAIISNTGKPAPSLYADYKTRANVETMINALKNILDADHSHLRDEHALEGWMFVNLLALKWYYTLLNVLKKHALNAVYSPSDLLLFLSEIKKVKINGIWHQSEVTKKTAELARKIGIGPIT